MEELDFERQFFAAPQARARAENGSAGNGRSRGSSDYRAVWYRAPCTACWPHHARAAGQSIDRMASPPLAQAQSDPPAVEASGREAAAWRKRRRFKEPPERMRATGMNSHEVCRFRARNRVSGRRCGVRDQRWRGTACSGWQLCPGGGHTRQGEYLSPFRRGADRHLDCAAKRARSAIRGVKAAAPAVAYSR